MPSGQHLIINAQRWYSATPVGGDPGSFSAYSADPTPSWYVLDGPSGARSAVPNDPIDIPMITGVDAGSARITAAASRPPGYLYLLTSATISSSPVTVLQFLLISPNGAVSIQAEELLPTPGSVTFNRGLQYDTPYLYVYGSDSAGHVYRMRKLWAKVGFNKQLTVPLVPQQGFGIVGNQVGWEYFTGSGYDADPSKIGIISGLTTVGPMSFASLRNKWLMSTVTASGSTRSAQLYTMVAGRPVRPVGTPLALGSTSTGSYLGLGAQLQPQLTADPTNFPTGSTAGVPYVISTRTGTSGDYSLRNVWNIYGWPS
jgi:hypothetical protein